MSDIRQPGTGAKVVIVGAGFGGLAAAQALADTAASVTLIDRRNHHLFQPLLYQVATAALSPSDIATPIRSIFRNRRNVSVILGEVDGVDAGGREVRVGSRRIPYDYLVIATGARHGYFGHDEWGHFAPGLKTLEDATGIRRHVLEAFERAEVEEDPVERCNLLSFVIVGGGPTGVEMAGAIAELARRVLTKDYRNFDELDPRVALIEAGRRLLPGFHERLSASAERVLTRLGVTVLTGSRVTQCDVDGVVVDGVRRAARTIVWAAGVKASPAAEWVQAETDGAGRARVGSDLALPDRPEIFVIGDTAHAVEHAGGAPFPGTAAVAKQQGRYVGRLIAARIRGRGEPGPFRYRHYGNLATIGRKAAVADFGRVRLGGMAAWVIWSLAHVFFLAGYGNRLSVLSNWAWAYLTYNPRARLITGDDRIRPVAVSPTVVAKADTVGA